MSLCGWVQIMYSLLLFWIGPKFNVIWDKKNWKYLLHRVQAVWPDVETKISPNFTISSLKISHRSFYLKGMFFKVDQKINKYLGNFSEKLCHQNISKIWSHCKSMAVMTLLYRYVHTRLPTFDTQCFIVPNLAASNGEISITYLVTF